MWMTYLGKSMAEIQKFKEHLKNIFDIEVLGEAKYFLGLNIERDRKNGITKIHQKQYISIMKKS